MNRRDALRGMVSAAGAVALPAFVAAQAPAESAEDADGARTYTDVSPEFWGFNEDNGWSGWAEFRQPLPPTHRYPKCVREGSVCPPYFLAEYDSGRGALLDVTLPFHVVHIMLVDGTGRRCSDVEEEGGWMYVGDEHVPHAWRSLIEQAMVRVNGRWPEARLVATRCQHGVWEGEWEERGRTYGDLMAAMDNAP